MIIKNNKEVVSDPRKQRATEIYSGDESIFSNVLPPREVIIGRIGDGISQVEQETYMKCAKFVTAVGDGYPDDEDGRVLSGLCKSLSEALRKLGGCK